MERIPFQPASIKEATEGLTSIKDDFPSGNPMIQPVGYSTTSIYVAIVIAIVLAITIGVIASIFMKRNK